MSFSTFPLTYLFHLFHCMTLKIYMKLILQILCSKFEREQELHDCEIRYIVITFPINSVFNWCHFKRALNWIEWLKLFKIIKHCSYCYLPIMFLLLNSSAKAGVVTYSPTVGATGISVNPTLSLNASFETILNKNIKGTGIYQLIDCVKW